MAEPRELDVVQKWFQTVITHPAGVGEGIESAAARDLVPLHRKDLERVIRRSRRVSAHDRLSIYANAYYARLLECLGECFPVLKRTVGDDLFNEFAFGYLQRYPSRSYTLDQLGQRFAQYLEETRPDRTDAPDDDAPATVTWPDFLVDLTRFEWTIGVAFDGPGVEKLDPVTADQWQSVDPDRWPLAKLVPAPCLHLLCLRYPINDYYTAVRQAASGVEVSIPEPENQRIAINRRNYIVRRYEIDGPQFELLTALLEGCHVSQAIERAADASDLDDERLATALKRWFTTWTANQFFQTIEWPERFTR